MTTSITEAEKLCLPAYWASPKCWYDCDVLHRGPAVLRPDHSVRDRLNEKANVNAFKVEKSKFKVKIDTFGVFHKIFGENYIFEL